MAQLKIFRTRFAKFQRDEIFKYSNQRLKRKTNPKRIRAIINEKTEHLKLDPNLRKPIPGIFCRILILKKTADQSVCCISFWENHQKS